MRFDEVRSKWPLRPIHNCPGRFVIHPPSAQLSPRDLLGANIKVHTFQVAAARDTVLVVRLKEGGLISYKRTDGSYCHTLNTAEGFVRKLLDLNIGLEDECTEGGNDRC